MKTYYNIQEVEADIKDGVLKVHDDIEIAFDGFEIEADIVCYNLYVKGRWRNITARNITARNITARNINAWNINACNINACNITARNITAEDITARNIDAANINARNINACNITTRNITAEDISYYAVCFAYDNITCTSIKGRRDNAKHFSLDGEITINTPQETIEIAGKTYNKKEVEERLAELKEVK